MALLLKSPIRHFQTIPPFTGNYQFGWVSEIWLRERAIKWASRSCIVLITCGEYPKNTDPVALGTSGPLSDRDQRRDRDYATHGNSPNGLELSGR